MLAKQVSDIKALLLLLAEQQAGVYRLISKKLEALSADLSGTDIKGARSDADCGGGSSDGK